MADVAQDESTRIAGGALAPPLRDPAQRRVLGTLVISQILGGVGLSGGIAVGSLLAEDILGDAEFAGLANTAQILGAALIAPALARLMAARGRRVGLSTGYLLAALGAVIALVSAQARSFPLLLLGALLFGAATTSNSQSRFAAIDLSQPERRGRDLSIIVWVTTIGAVVGPNLLGPTAPLGEALGLNPVVGVWVVSFVVFVLAAGWLTWRLRPDPLLLARERAEADGSAHTPHGTMGRALAVVFRSANATAGMLTIALGHAVMVAVMVMTPLHITHSGGGLELVGFVISMHVLGMYAFSPVTGMVVDRFGGRIVAVVGASILLLACALGATTSGDGPTLTVALFLLGLGWSGTLIAGSTLLTQAVPAEERPGVQGAADLVMGLCAAVAGGLSGVIVATLGYSWLSILGGVIAGVLLVILAVTVRTSARPSSSR